jgi:hypothetical protein
VFVEVVIVRTRIVAGCRADCTSRAGCTYWSGRTSRADRTSRAGRTCLVWLGDSFLSPKCVPASKNTNTTRGTLLVLKACMKLVICPCHFRDFDGRKLVAKTVNKLPQAKHFLNLEQSLDLTLDMSCIGVTTLQVPMHNSILYLLLKRSV